MAAAGLLANLLTLAIFDRRPAGEISVCGSHAFLAITSYSGWAWVEGRRRFLLTAPLLVDEGHLVLRAQSEFTWPTLIFYLITLFFAAAGEEMIFRGYAFQYLVEKMGPLPR